MSNSKTIYTLWTIPRSSWSHILENVTLSEEDKKKLIEFANQLDDNRLEDRLQPYNTPVTETTLSKSVGQK